ncbi:MAG: CPBP family intramembrane glutamic endopeptidase [Sphaerochaeta sp.]|uniref:CPBP family intramembrane glutamic endopeptidase n=1 Tax=Sphaerochaeta sp. TaxID=1972642 RepID=UPI002A3628B9|nr:CPBP family intramembrane glutamic endopeptidase [Sphaerochaeta sp.]MDX9825017.1 CPBP family intramembrane glutamic endopeptidase [Sphaerochaeta sp.]
MRKEERWEMTGWTIGLIMAAVTGLVLYFQTSASGYSFKLWPNLIMVLPMAAVNAFTEEVVFRLSYVTSTENAGLSPTWAMALGSLVFGFVHYWGIAPKWTLGAVLVAYIGFFLTKSSLETKGFLFAWAVHAILDVVILTFLFNTHP